MHAFAYTVDFNKNADGSYAFLFCAYSTMKKLKWKDLLAHEALIQAAKILIPPHKYMYL